MSETETGIGDLDPGDKSRTVNPAIARRIALVVVILGVSALGAYILLKEPPSPPPAEIADDPLLVEGRELFLSRCVSCHGKSGRGDGPIAKGLAGPPVGDLTDRLWKHGDKPEQVLSVVTSGVKDTAMSGWKGIFSPQGIRAVSAYVYYLAGRDVPPALREP
jgi:cytochrome c oxidase cbb3-type subunit 3